MEDAIWEPLMLTVGEARAVEALFLTGSKRAAAELLGISYWTEHRHLMNVYEKAGVNSAIDLVRLAMQNGGFLY